MLDGFIHVYNKTINFFGCHWTQNFGLFFCHGCVSLEE
jgi:hypothetical protein